MRSTTFSPPWTLFRSDRLTGSLLVNQVDQGGLIVVLELLRLERPGLLVHDMLSEVEHVFGDFDVLNLVEILILAAYFVWVSQQRTHEPLVSTAPTR